MKNRPLGCGLPCGLIWPRGVENLILDIRGNGGGSDSAYEPLLRLLYDHEGAEDAMEYRVSDLAVAHVREFAGDTERGRGKIARMERTPAGSS